MFGWLKSKKPLPSPVQSEIVPEEFDDPSAILETFTALTGIHFRHKETIVTAKLTHFCRHHAIRSFTDLRMRLKSDPQILQALINHLTVNETYFFREPAQIEFMARRIAKTNKAVRILCAPGSTGEEPYSIAMMLMEHRIAPSLIDIVSIDINSEAIEKAREGIYNHRSLHKTSADLEERYFIKGKETIRVRDEVKRCVRFVRMNVFDLPSLATLGNFDYIFSRNMLIYFDPPVAMQAIEHLTRLARSTETLFFFGHADIVSTPSTLREHYEERVKYYSLP